VNGLKPASPWIWSPVILSALSSQPRPWADTNGPGPSGVGPN
jgi:hypothetical protein